MGPRSRGAMRPRPVQEISLKRQREQGKPGARSTRSPCALVGKHTVVTTVAPEVTRLSPRNGFNGFLRALPGDEFLFVTVADRLAVQRNPVRLAKPLPA